MKLLAVIGLALVAAGATHAASPPRWIVFSASPEHGTLPTQLFRVSTAGTGLRQITTGARPATEPAFSPDGRRVAFTRVNAGIFVIDADGSHLHRLTGDPNDRFPVWSPDGRRVAFVHAAARGVRLAVIGAGGHRQRIFRAGPQPAGRPSWTPGGRSLVLATEMGSFVQVSATTGRVQGRLRPSYDTRDGTPWWTLSPNGKTLALIARAPAPAGCTGLACDVFALYVAGVTSVRSRRVVDAGAFPGWTPDSRRIVWGAATGIAVESPTGGPPRTIPVDAADVPAADAPPAWQP